MCQRNRARPEAGAIGVTAGFASPSAPINSASQWGQNRTPMRGRYWAPIDIHAKDAVAATQRKPARRRNGSPRRGGAGV
jgi:hypothetical protein